MNNRMMKRGFAGMIAGLGIAATCLTATPRASADSYPPITNPIPFQSLQYQDNEGPGQLTIRDQGVDVTTDGRNIAVTLSQNGGFGTGAGYALWYGKSPNDGSDVYIIDFWLAGYEFRGTLSTDPQWSRVRSAGHIKQVGTGQSLEQWALQK